MSPNSAFPDRRKVALGTILLILALLGSFITARAEQTPASQDMTQTIYATLRHGDWHKALSLLRTYNEQFPDDKRMLYNQACLENRAGQKQQALAILQKALAAGFDQMGFALQDPDLKGVADDPRLFNLDTESRTRLFLLSRENQFRVGYQAWSQPVTLDPVMKAAEDSPSPTVRLGWQPAGLRLEITAPTPWDDFASSSLQPWADGANIIVVLAVPDSTTAFAGSNTFTFAFGSEKGGPVAAQFLPRQERWQRIAEMDPKLSHDAQGAVVLNAIIPWLAIMPYHPLVDPVLGINIEVRRDSAHDYAKAALIPDPWAWAPTAPSHRFVPVSFQLETVAEDLFMGSVSRSIGGDEPIELKLTVICPDGGKARLTLNFLDPAMHPVLQGGARSEQVELKQGLNTLVRKVDFRGLQTGAYLIRAGLRFPSGKEATWSTSVLQFAQGWQEDLENRIAKVRAADRPTLVRMLKAITEAVPLHLVRRSPGPISTTLQDLQSMLNQATATGSVLPGYGPVTLLYPGPAGGDRLCTLYLAAPADSTASILPVLILQQARGHEGILIDRIARNHEHGDLKPDPAFAKRPVYIVPHSPRRNLSESESEAEATACLHWALNYLGADRALVVGIDAGGGPALQLAGKEPDHIGRVLVFAGANLNPWPGATPSELAKHLSQPPATPVTWVGFPMETEQSGQGPAILRQLQQSGWRLTATSSVRGGLSLSQAADRLVLWTVGAVPPAGK